MDNKGVVRVAVTTYVVTWFDDANWFHEVRTDSLLTAVHLQCVLADSGAREINRHDSQPIGG